MNRTRLFIFSTFIILFNSCAFYTQNRMFRTEREYNVDSLKKKTTAAEKEYKIQPDDFLRVYVYTNSGERIIDPNYDLRKSTGTTAQGNQSDISNPKYLVKPDGMVRLPMVGEVYLKGLTTYEADSVLEKKYSEYYQDVFVMTHLANKRVVILGPLGGKVIPLENQSMNVIEVIALYGGIGDDGKAHNIRLIRGNLDDPIVQLIDLSTIEGMKQASLDVQPADIIYIEQSRKIISESVRDIAPLIGLIGNIVTILFLISR